MIAMLRDYSQLIAWAASAAIWIAAIWTVFSYGKFKRTWLWALLTLLSFSIPVPIGDGRWISLGLPIGALYVLGFAKFGPRAAPANRPLDLEG